MPQSFFGDDLFEVVPVQLRQSPPSNVTSFRRLLSNRGLLSCGGPVLRCSASYRTASPRPRAPAPHSAHRGARKLNFLVILVMGSIFFLLFSNVYGPGNAGLKINNGYQTRELNQ